MKLPYPPFDILKYIVTCNYGIVSAEDQEILRDNFPDLVLCVKMTYGQRFLSRARDLEDAINNNIKYHLDVHNVDQVVREVFISAEDCDRIVALFRWEKEMPKH